MLINGAKALSDVELLALIIGSGSSVEGVMSVSQNLLETVGGLNGLKRCCVAELMQASGIGVARACALAAIIELGRRMVSLPFCYGESLVCSEDVYKRIRGRLCDQEQELFFVIGLDAKQRVLSVSQVAQGSMTKVEVHPREVFCPMVRIGASAVIVVHNHPSGDPKPSEDDHKLTERLRQVGEIMGIPLIDHLVLGHNDYVSLADLGRI